MEHQFSDPISEGHHLPAQGWTTRMPSPPAIMIPAVGLDRLVNPVKVITSSSPQPQIIGFDNTQFVSLYPPPALNAAFGCRDWKYEQRRTAQQILPFLFLGPSQAIRDADFLQSNNITMLLAVRNTLSAEARLLQPKVAKNLDIRSEVIDVAGNQELIAAFPRAIDVINNHLQSRHQQHQSQNDQTSLPNPQGKVLVYCESGNERSASVVAAYLMAVYSMDLVSAIQLIQTHRFAVAFNDSTKELLRTYETILEAKRDVNHYKYALSPNGNIERRGLGIEMITRAGSVKRSLDDMDEEDEVMDVSEDGANGQKVDGARHRDGVAPFRG